MGRYLAELKKYAAFGGRSRRKEYRYFVLFSVIVSLVLSAIDALLGTFSYSTNVGLLGGIYGLAIIVPSVAVSVRRLHDIDRTGWWVPISLVPVIGTVVLLVFAASDGTPGENRFGPNPKASGKVV
jgi:uncharacterized membrane protein YhaH (DUF805 family)